MSHDKLHPSSVLYRLLPDGYQTGLHVTSMNVCVKVAVGSLPFIYFHLDHGDPERIVVRV